MKIDFKQMKIDRDSSDKAKVDHLNKFNHALGSLKEKDSEILLLKKSIQQQSDDALNYKSDLRKVNKVVKEKEKEIYRLESKSDNLAANCKSFKEEITRLKKERSKLEKENNVLILEIKLKNNS